MPPCNAILAIDSEHDVQTAAAAAYRAARVYPYFEQKGYRVIYLRGYAARRAAVLAAAADPAVGYITGSGHGYPGQFTGHHGEVLLGLEDLGTAEIAGKIVKLLACDCGQTLGPALAAHGASAFFGYRDDFILHAFHRDAFFECDAEIDRALADGLNASDAASRARSRFAARAATFRAEQRLLAAAALEAAATVLCAPAPGGPCGDPHARLDPASPA